MVSPVVTPHAYKTMSVEAKPEEECAIVEAKPEEACAICLDSPTHPHEVTCCAKTVYCFQCIRGWSSQNNSCPFCRTSYGDSEMVCTRTMLKTTIEHDAAPYKIEGMKFDDPRPCFRCGKKYETDEEGDRASFCQDACEKWLCWDCHGPFDSCIVCTFGKIDPATLTEAQGVAESAMRQRELLSPAQELLQAECYVVIEMLTRDPAPGTPRIFDEESRTHEESCTLIRKKLFDPLRGLYARTKQIKHRIRRIAPSIIRSRDIMYNEFTNSHPDSVYCSSDEFLEWYEEVTHDLESTVHKTIEECIGRVSPRVKDAISTAVAGVRKRDLSLLL